MDIGTGRVGAGGNMLNRPTTGNDKNILVLLKEDKGVVCT